MGINLKELRKISNFCRKSGIIIYETGEFKLTFSERALKLPKPKPKKVEIPIAGLPNNMPDLTLWSSTPFLGEANG